MQFVFWKCLCSGLKEDSGGPVELIWSVPTPVGGPARLGTLCSSNWGISFFSLFFFFFLMKERGLTSLFPPLSFFNPSESHGLYPFHLQIVNLSLAFSLSFSQNLLGLFVLSWVAHVLRFFSLSLSHSVSHSLTDLSVGEWQQDSSSGNTSRVLSYTIALNNPLGPKTAPVVETQVSPWQTPAIFRLVI